MKKKIYKNHKYYIIAQNNKKLKILMLMTKSHKKIFNKKQI